MSEYRVTIKTQEGNLIKEIHNFDPENWSDLIRKTKQRYDYILTLNRRFILKGEQAGKYIKDFKPCKENYLIMNDNLLIGKWEIWAEINTKYH